MTLSSKKDSPTFEIQLKFLKLELLVMRFKYISSMALKPINIPWKEPVLSHNEKNIYSIVLRTISDV